VLQASAQRQGNGVPSPAGGQDRYAREPLLRQEAEDLVGDELCQLHFLPVQPMGQGAAELGLGETARLSASPWSGARGRLAQAAPHTPANQDRHPTGDGCRRQPCGTVGDRWKSPVRGYLASTI